MWFGLFLLLLFPLLAYGVVRAIWWLRNADYDPDSCEEKQGHFSFVRWGALYLGAGMVLCIPLVVQWREDMRLRMALLQQPLVLVMERYHPQIYYDLVKTVSESELQGEALDNAVLEAVIRLRQEWAREVPYASLDGVAQFVRYHYHESAVLAKEDETLCAQLKRKEIPPIDPREVRFMQNNEHYISEAMVATFDSVDFHRRLNFLDQRFASENALKIRQKLAKEFALPEASSVQAPTGEAYRTRSCSYDKAYYLALLDYSDSEMAKIVRWSMTESRQ